MGAWSLQQSNRALDDVVRTTQISSAYESALQSITEAQVRATSFMDSPNEADRTAFDDALLHTADALAYIQINGSAEDRILIARIFAEYGSQVQQMTTAFDQAQMGVPFTGNDLPPAQIIEDVKNQLDAPQMEHQQQATTIVDSYRSAQRTRLLLGLAGFALGLPMMLLLLQMVRRFERREALSQLQMMQLERAALADGLTGLGNHRAFQEELEMQVTVALAAARHLSLALIDIDDFKEVNDSGGHARGDQFLVELTNLLRQNAARQDHLFRIGGDEFAVILPGVNQHDARIRMEHLRQTVAEKLTTVSIGIAELEPGDDVEILREKADATLYTAKRRGRNAVAEFSGDTSEQGIVTQSKINALRDLIRAQDIDIAFQPVWDSACTNIVGYEALARIPPGFELSDPHEAFTIAERLGRGQDLDEICLTETLRRAHEVPPRHLLFVNLAPRTLEHAEFSAEALYQRVVAAGLRPDRICFEITERSTAPIDILAREAKLLRERGFRIALDDVGSGNSGLEMLRQIEVDYVKVDQSVMHGALKDVAGRAVMLAIVVFASEAGAFVIAEGIETMAMLRLVREINGRAGPFNIQGVQGYLLGKPQLKLSNGEGQDQLSKLSA